MKSVVNEKGITLVELLIVCVVISFAFLGLANLFPVSMASLNESRMHTTAADFAQEKMEDLLELDGTHADLTAGTHNDPDNPIRSSFNRQWVVTDNTPANDLKTIEVTVTYPHGDKTRSVTLASFRRD
ncbi:MAG: prepilin-type N-terminal cleavage/methylation domain-containing protein [bacterium]|jgi:Tfp pilus assembly protein PilV